MFEIRSCYLSFLVGLALCNILFTRRLWYALRPVIKMMSRLNFDRNTHLAHRQNCCTTALRQDDLACLETVLFSLHRLKKTCPTNFISIVANNFKPTVKKMLMSDFVFYNKILVVVESESQLNVLTFIAMTLTKNAHIE